MRIKLLAKAKIGMRFGRLTLRREIENVLESLSFAYRL